MMKTVNQFLLFMLFLRIIPILFFLSVISAHAQYRNDNPEYSKCSGPSKMRLKSIATVNQQFQKYDVNFYKLDVSVSDSTTFISGNTLIRSVVKSNVLDTFVIELTNQLHVDSVLFNGSTSVFTHSNDLITIVPVNIISQNSFFDVKVFYHGTSVNNGLYTKFDTISGNHVTWTLAEPFYAKGWFPCKQDLNDKADSSYVFITTDASCKAGSNGLLTASVPLPSGKVRYEWKTQYPIDFYLISLAVSKYIDYSIYAHPAGTTDSLLIQNYVYSQSVLNYYKSEIDMTRNYIELFSNLFGIYPYMKEKYGHCMAPIGGGMEHQTMTTLGYFDLVLISHELGHEWFGDLVTCASWQDIWVNEGIASYTEYLAWQNIVSQTMANSWMNYCHFRALGSPTGSVYVPFDQIDNEGRIFNYNLTYKKGASIIHMMRYLVNNDILFFQVFRNYLNQFKNKTATGLDFKNVLEATTSIDFTEFFNQWYFGEGYPVYKIAWSYSNDTLSLTSLQTTTTSSPSLFKMPMQYRLYYANGDSSTISVMQTLNTNNYKIYCPDSVVAIKVDPDQWFLLKVDTITKGVTEHSFETDITCNPNPFSDVIKVQFGESKGIKQVELLDISGRRIVNFSFSEKHCSLDVSTLSKGTYFIKITTTESTVVKKLMKI